MGPVSLVMRSLLACFVGFRFFCGIRSFGFGFRGWAEVGGRSAVAFRGGWICCYSVVVIPGDTFCSRVRHAVFLEGQAASSRVTVSNNRSVMPLDVLGRTRATLKESACFTLPVRKDRVTAEPPSWLGLGTAMIPMNQESLVGAGH